jgi:tetratricopeptide (TPR) repeat protein
MSELQRAAPRQGPDRRLAARLDAATEGASADTIWAAVDAALRLGRGPAAVDGLLRRLPDDDPASPFARALAPFAIAWALVDPRALPDHDAPPDAPEPWATRARLARVQRALLRGEGDAARLAEDAARSATTPADVVDARLARAHASLFALRHLPPQADASSLLRRALAEATHALKVATAAAAREREADALSVAARCLVDLRDYAKGRALHEAALAHHEALGQRPGVVASLGGLGVALLGLHETARGAVRIFQAVTLARDLDLLAVEAAWRVQLDHVLVLLDRTETRIEELERTIEVARGLGDEPWRARLLADQAEAAASVRDRARAHARWRDAAEAWAGLGDQEAEAQAWLRVAELAAQLGLSADAPLARVLGCGTPAQVDTARRMRDGVPFLDAGG